MQVRILPMPQNSTKKWTNWLEYLNRIESEIKSLKSYLNYFNPDNVLVNMQDRVTFDESIDMYVYNIEDLKFREYIQINHENAVIKINDSIKEVPIAYTVRCMKNDPTSLNDFQLLSGSAISLYYINQLMDGLSFTYLTPQDGVLGTSFSFNIAGFPSRYAYQGSLTTFNEKSSQWSSPAVNYEYTSSTVDVLIGDAQNLIWDGIYPIMHKLELKDNNMYEDFIADDNFIVDKTNIANHITMRYTINIQNVDRNNIDLRWVAVNII